MYFKAKLYELMVLADCTSKKKKWKLTPYSKVTFDFTDGKAVAIATDKESVMALLPIKDIIHRDKESPKAVVVDMATAVRMLRAEGALKGDDVSISIQPENYGKVIFQSLSYGCYAKLHLSWELMNLIDWWEMIPSKADYTFGASSIYSYCLDRKNIKLFGKLAANMPVKHFIMHQSKAGEEYNRTLITFPKNVSDLRLFFAQRKIQLAEDSTYKDFYYYRKEETNE